MASPRMAPVAESSKEALAKDPKDKKGLLTISAPNFEIVALVLSSVAPYVQLRMSEKSKNAMLEKMAAGGPAKNRKNRPARDYGQEYKDAQYIAADGVDPDTGKSIKGGWNGIPASSFRNAAVSACRIAGYAMVKAKLSIFVEADGVDVLDGTPLVRIVGTPEKVTHPVRNANGGTDHRVRAMWRNWKTTIRVRYDADQFTTQDVVNLLSRVGMQVGVGEGRPDSKFSCGMGWGLFSVSKVGK